MTDSGEYKLEAGDAHQKYRKIARRDVFIDHEGFLRYFNEWTEEIAAVLAAEN